MKTKNKALGNGLFTVAPHQLDTQILTSNYAPKLKRKTYPQKSIYTIPNLLSPKECKDLIATAENIGFQQAGLAIEQDVYRVKEKTRNNQRVMFEDIEMSKLLYQRIEHLVDKKYQNHIVHGLNWRFRVYKYPVGGIFAPHVDERMVLGDGDLTTLFTFMIYLNDNLKGGETTFFDRRTKGQKRLNTNRVIRPKEGMALVFDHLLFHEGSVVTKGYKYVLRSDLIYKKK